MLLVLSFQSFLQETTITIYWESMSIQLQIQNVRKLRKLENNSLEVTSMTR
jgi:hypothetical protein